MNFGYQILGFGAGGAPANWIEATGGTTVEYNDGGVDYKAHFYLATSTFVVAALGKDASHGDKVDYFVIAGGGGAGGSVAGGGGGGGAVTTSGLATVMTVGTHPITIGAGGPSAYNAPVDGDDSVIFVGAPIAAT